MATAKQEQVRIFIGIYISIAMLLLLYTVLLVLPAAERSYAAVQSTKELAKSENIQDGNSSLPGAAMFLDLDSKSIMALLAIVFGGLGGTGRAAVGFASDQDKLILSLFRPPIGMLFAVLVYTGIKAGLIQSGSGQLLQPFGIAFVSGVVGLFPIEAAKFMVKVFTVIRLVLSGSDSQLAESEDEQGPLAGSATDD